MQEAEDRDADRGDTFPVSGKSDPAVLNPRGPHCQCIEAKKFSYVPKIV